MTWNIAGWFAVGLTVCIAGGVALIQESDSANAVGWVLIALGGVVIQIGVIAAGVFVALREHDEA